MSDRSREVRPRLAKTPAAQHVTLPLAPSRERRRLQAYLILMVADGLAIFLGFLCAGLMLPGRTYEAQGLLQAQIMIPLFWTVAIGNGAYSASALIDVSFSRMRAGLALAIALSLVMTFAFATRSSLYLSRATMGLGFGLTLVLLVLVRRATQPLIVRFVGATAHNVLVIDHGGQPLRVPHAYHIDAREHGLDPDLSDPHMLDRIGLYMTNMDRVIVSCPREQRPAWALIFRGAHIQGEIVDREVDELGVIGAQRGFGYGSLVVSTGALGLRQRAMKRTLDLSVALTALVLLSPLLLLVAVAVLLADGRPLLFVQARLGRGNTFFKMYKFRSMVVSDCDNEGKNSTGRKDLRVTKVGRWIRKTSIDELPQLFNVLFGHMSLVGPRPHAIGSLGGTKLFWEIDQRYWLRHALKPGLTGLAQVRGLRGATDTESDLSDRLEADLEYLVGWSLLRDFQIMARTARVLVHERAY